MHLNAFITGPDSLGLNPKGTPKYAHAIVTQLNCEYRVGRSDLVVSLVPFVRRVGGLNPTI